ncbi:MAG: pentapeptide repeat-containing protein [Acidimicrobiales bacterium]
MVRVYPPRREITPLGSDCDVARKRLVGPSVRQLPRLDNELAERTGDALDDHDLLEEVHWEGGGAPTAVSGVEIVRSRLTRIRLTGLELADLTLLDVVLVDCELSGTVLTGARWERAVFTRCSMSGVVATELKGSDLRFEDCKMDQAWLRGAGLDRCELVDCDLTGADLYDARITRSSFRRCDLTGVEVTGSDFEAVSLHGSVVDRLTGAESLHGVTIGSDQLVPLALPILAARRIRVDDDPPDLVDEVARPST